MGWYLIMVSWYLRAFKWVHLDLMLIEIDYQTFPWMARFGPVEDSIHTIRTCINIIIIITRLPANQSRFIPPPRSCSCMTSLLGWQSCRVLVGKYHTVQLYSLRFRRSLHTSNVITGSIGLFIKFCTGWMDRWPSLHKLIDLFRCTFNLINCLPTSNEIWKTNLWSDTCLYYNGGEEGGI